MVKEHNMGRILLLTLIGVFINGLIAANLVKELVFYIQGGNNSINFYLSIDFLMIAVVVVLYNNIAVHVISESSTTIRIDESCIRYKTLFTKERIVYTKDIKKIVFCNEVIFPRGEYKNTIILLKGMRRSILVSEYTMTKEQYTNISESITIHLNNALYEKKGKYYKQLLMLFGW